MPSNRGSTGAPHDLPLEPVHRANAEADGFRGLDDAGAVGEGAPCGLQLLRLSPWPAELGAHDAAPGLKLAVPGQLVLDDLESGSDPLLDHASLELGEGARYLEEQLALWRGRVEVLLIEVEVNADGLQVLDRVEEVDQRTAEPIDRPGHHHVELPAQRILKHAVEPWPLVASLGAAYAGVAVDLDDGPATALGDIGELADLVLNRLVIGADAHIKCRTLCCLHGEPSC